MGSMNLEGLAQFALDETQDLVLITDPGGYGLLYLNAAGLNRLGNPPREEWYGKPCYEVLQGLEGPCPFCPVAGLERDSFRQWEYYNAKLKRHYFVRDKLADYYGETVHLEIATDVTEAREATHNLRERLQTDEALIACTQILALTPNLNEAIERLLESVGSYYEAERTYIFEIDWEAETIHYAYEWCKPGVRPELGRYEVMPLAYIERWLVEFRSRGEVCIEDVQSLPDKTGPEYQILSQQNIRSLIAAPLLADGQIIGFCGVDNPERYKRGGELLRSVAIFIASDIGKRHLTEKLTKLSYTDSLTGARNRHAYTVDLQELGEGGLSSLGVVFVDINGLKLANDSYGHDYGDYLLRHTADVLRGTFGRRVYRVGGDEFVALCPDQGKAEFEARVSTLQRLKQQDGDVDFSVGANWDGGDNISPAQVANRSDELMYADKQEYYKTRPKGMGNYRYNLTRTLTQELGQGQFCVFLQPKVDLWTQTLQGAEALIRRRDGNGVYIPPVQFVPLYEAEGVIRHLDFFVLDAVCAFIRSWEDRGCRLPRISVNCSRVTILEPHIVEKLCAVCAEHGVSPSHIILEITEHIGNMEKHGLETLTKALKAVGFLLSLDDFGSEYSNLALLSTLHFDEVKLDKSLVDNVETSRYARIVVQHIVTMCREMRKIKIVAEGVETEGQRELLCQLNCQVGQGYLFDRPLPLEAFAEKYITGPGAPGAGQAERELAMSL